MFQDECFVHGGESSQIRPMHSGRRGDYIILVAEFWLQSN